MQRSKKYLVLVVGQLRAETRSKELWARILLCRQHVFLETSTVIQLFGYQKCRVLPDVCGAEVLGCLGKMVKNHKVSKNLAAVHAVQ